MCETRDLGCAYGRHAVVAKSVGMDWVVGFSATLARTLVGFSATLARTLCTKHCGMTQSTQPG